MAGYIFNLDSTSSLGVSIENGVYGTIMSKPRNKLWGSHHEATFADYCTMKSGDNVYFFIERNIYGIGILINIKENCRFNNYQAASYPENLEYKDIKDNILYDIGEGSENIRWICTFKPEPYFFKMGIDMDDALASNPHKFKMLRAFWKRSFIKIDDEENDALKDIILKRNEEFIFSNDESSVFKFNNRLHINIENKLSLESYFFDITPLVHSCNDNKKLKHEMALEAAILAQISSQENDTIEIFGSWDYLSHQVPASPFKPIDYMDRMDLFGYRYIKGYRTVSKYLVVELKKDRATIEDIEQVLKYVDWVREEYAHGDYSMIEAALVASNISKDVIEYAETVAERNYTIGRRPARSKRWTNLKLIQYEYDGRLGMVKFDLAN